MKFSDMFKVTDLEHFDAIQIEFTSIMDSSNETALIKIDKSYVDKDGNKSLYEDLCALNISDIAIKPITISSRISTMKDGTVTIHNVSDEYKILIISTVSMSHYNKFVNEKLNRWHTSVLYEKFLETNTTLNIAYLHGDYIVYKFSDIIHLASYPKSIMDKELFGKAYHAIKRIVLPDSNTITFYMNSSKEAREVLDEIKRRINNGH